MIITLLNYKPPSWNKFYSGTHWAKRQMLVNECQIQMNVATVGQRDTYTKPVDVKITTYSPRPQDSDNIADKLIVDSLKHCGILVDDTPKYVRWVATRSLKGKSNKTVIEIDTV